MNLKELKIEELLDKIHVLAKRIESKEFYSNDRLCGKYFGQTKDEFKIELLKMDLELELLKMDLELFKMKEGLS